MNKLSSRQVMRWKKKTRENCLCQDESASSSGRVVWHDDYAREFSKLHAQNSRAPRSNEGRLGTRQREGDRQRTGRSKGNERLPVKSFLAFWLSHWPASNSPQNNDTETGKKIPIKNKANWTLGVNHLNLKTNSLNYTAKNLWDR